jgi:prephenate dehydrogenase
MRVTIIGLGLIGGSLALALRRKGLATAIVGVEANEAHAEIALSRGLADMILPLEAAVDRADLIVLAVPVDAVESLLPSILDRVEHQVVMDMGSIKERVLHVTRDHPRRGRFVATHPMWGTEYSGPQAAIEGAFSGKAAVICNSEGADEDALRCVESLYRSLGMHLVYMEAVAHDMHVAYISHISHITSFALANTVLEKEREEDAIFELASGGFESTVRLAKSNAAMWVPVLMQNKENVLDVLNEHLSQLRKFKACLEKEDTGRLYELIGQANTIRRILK